MNQLTPFSSLAIRAAAKQDKIDVLTNFIFYFLILLIIFFICREIIMWYWKINERVKLSQSILSTLERIEKLVSYQVGNVTQPQNIDESVNYMNTEVNNDQEINFKTEQINQ